MKCVKCDSYVYSTDKFCRGCGATLNQDTCQYGDNISNSKYDSSSCHEKQYTYSYEYSNKEKPTYNINATHKDQYDYSSKYSFDYSKYNYFAKPNDSGDDKYIKSYIGPNYDKIKKMKFSFPAFLFGPWYLLYRKVWGYAIGTIIISLAAAILLESNFADVVNLIINIFLGIKFQSIYTKQAENHVENIKQQNLDKSTTELLDVCKKKGGTSVKGTIIAIIGIFAAYIALAIILVTTSEPEKLNTSDPMDKTNNIEQKITKQIDKLTYTLPEEFQTIYSSNNLHMYNYYNNNTDCNFKVEKRTAYGINSDPDTYLNSISTTAANTINLNGYIWKYKQYTLSNFQQTVYARKHQDELYIITLNNTNYYSCNQEYDKILPTMQFQRF